MLKTNQIKAIIIFLAAACFLALPLAAQGQAKKVVTIETKSDGTTVERSGGREMSQIFTYNDITYTNDVFTDDFDSTPSWSVEAGEPPLSIGKAIEIARQNLRRFARKEDIWKVTGVGMQEFVEGKWFYGVSFQSSGLNYVEEAPNKYRLLGNEFHIIVKMDGKIIEPKVKPAESQGK
jgi:hypothetical protein